MKKKFRFFYVVLAMLAVFAFKWNCLTWRYLPEIAATNDVPGQSAEKSEMTNVVSVETNSIVSGWSVGKKTHKTYRGIPLAELISLPWTREKAFQAQHEPWWGRPFNPVLFWEGHPVWMDDESVLLANRHGRVYPPVPIQYAAKVPSKQLVSDNSTIEYRMPLAYYTQEEQTFWRNFNNRNPHPPESIDRWLQRWGTDRVLSTKRVDAKLPDGREIKKTTIPLPKEPQSTVEAARSSAKNLNMPFEAATEFALYWEYVRGMRFEYEKESQISKTTGSELNLKSFFDRLECPSELVRQPPSDEEIRVTNGWRIEYLRRLRREGTDESYIEAYKKAWNLSEDDLREDAE